MVVRRGIPALRFLETIVGFLKLVELCKGLVVLPCLASLVEVYGARTTPWQMGNCNALNLGGRFFSSFYSPNSGVTLFSLPVSLLLPNFKPV
jgi:hypothetical protein